MPAGIMGQFASALSTSPLHLRGRLLQVVPAVLLFLNRYVPLGLTLLAPVIVNICLVHILMAQADCPSLPSWFVLWLLVFYRVRSAFAGSLSGVCRTRPDRQSGLFSTIKAVMIQYLYLGRVPYDEGLRFQAEFGRSPPPGRVDNVLLLLEHPPVLTLGRNANRSNILASDELCQSRGVTLHEINAGGDVTYHGPGQLVGYPIFDLRSLRNPNSASASVR